MLSLSMETLKLIIIRLFWQTHLAGNNKLLKLHNGSPYAQARRIIFKLSWAKCSGGYNLKSAPMI